MNFRTLAERISRNRVLKRRLPDRAGQGVAYVSPDSALRYWRKDLEQSASELFDLAEQHIRPGMCVWDVGANQGLFALAAAHWASSEGAVFAFEPDPFFAHLIELSANCAADSTAPIDVRNVAVSANSGKAKFCVATRGRSASFLSTSTGSSQAGGVRNEIEVPTVDLDSQVGQLGIPDMLKVDVEGAELDVLAGGAVLFSLYRPILAIEVCDANRKAVSERLKSWGYRLFDMETGEGPMDVAPFNCIAHPWR